MAKKTNIMKKKLKAIRAWFRELRNEFILNWLHEHAHKYGFYHCEWGFATGRYWLEVGNSVFIEDIEKEHIKTFVERSFGGDWMKEHIKSNRDN